MNNIIRTKIYSMIEDENNHCEGEFMKRLVLIMAVLILSACSQNTESDMRIVSLIPSNTEIVSELIGTDHLVGVTTVDTYPESLNESDIERIDTFNLEPETIIELNPTHIISHASINEMTKAEIDQVVDATDAELLVVDDAVDISGVYETIEDIGEFLKVTDESDAFVEKMKRDYKSLVDTFKDKDAKTAFVLISQAPDFYIAGNDTFMDSILADVKIDNVFNDIDGFPLVDIEEIIDREPEYLISAIGMNDTELNDMIQNEKGFKNMAFTDKNKQCNPDVDEISRPGPRIISGVKSVAECIHE